MLTHARLLEVLDYEPLTGEFRWKDWRPGTTKGKTGSAKDRYVRLRIDGALYYGHRLAWFYVHGVWPQRIDHRDRNEQNNTLANLREATKSQNQANIATKNPLGLKGVTPHGRRFKAQIGYNGKHKHLGVYDTAEEAHAAYMLAAKYVFGEFASP